MRRPSRAVVAAATLIGSLVLGSMVRADPRWFKPPEALRLSDVIIVATLTEANLKVIDDVRCGEGDLKAEKIFLNRTSARSPFRLRWKDRVRLICPRQDLERLLGTRAIWLLQEGPEGTVTASVYGQIFPLETDHDLEFAIREFERVSATDPVAWQAESILAFLRAERDRAREAAR